MGNLLIEGVERIHGGITLGGNKNLALPALATAVLAGKGATVLHNVPDIVDVRNMLGIPHASPGEFPVPDIRHTPTATI